MYRFSYDVIYLQRSRTSLWAAAVMKQINAATVGGALCATAVNQTHTVSASTVMISHVTSLHVPCSETINRNIVLTIMSFVFSYRHIKHMYMYISTVVDRCASSGRNYGTSNKSARLLSASPGSAHWRSTSSAARLSPVLFTVCAVALLSVTCSLTSRSIAALTSLLVASDR